MKSFQQIREAKFKGGQDVQDFALGAAAAEESLYGDGGRATEFISKYKPKRKSAFYAGFRAFKEYDQKAN